MKKTIRGDVAKSYLSCRGLDDTVWGEIIINAEARGRFHDSEIRRAADWQTCACGEQHEDIPRWTPDMTKQRGGKVAGAPVDEDLAMLGEAFYQAVHYHHFVNAASALVAIEVRAKEVLASNRATRGLSDESETGGVEQ